MEGIKYLNFYKNDKVFDDVFSLLTETDQDFVPTLSSKFSIDEIVNKYIKFANIIIAYKGNKPIGLVSFYANPNPKDSYLSLITVSENFRGYQVGKNLELKCLEFCANIKSKGVVVNMRKSNIKLLNSRLNLGYKIINEYKLEYSNELIFDLYLEY